MAGDGMPEQAVQRCGEAIARLRTARGWSRARLLAQVYRELDLEDVTYETLSEAWLARLENGRVVKVSRPVIEALCRALKCTPQERVHVLTYADRNVLYPPSSDEAPDVVAELLNTVMEQIYREAHDVMLTMVGQQRAATLSDLELLEIAAAVIDLVVAEHKRTKGNTP
jgi:transcriptional regulator with XRE-family HTH domain